MQREKEITSTEPVPSLGIWGLVLKVLASIYEKFVRLRIGLYNLGLFRSRKLKTPVISVGNLTVGGTGKTPCTAYIANLLQNEGNNVAILSRGYKRSGKGIVEVSDGNEILCGPVEAGDEPYLMAMKCPGVRVIVGGDRFSAGKYAENKYDISVFLLDDGYQHLRLKRDLNLLLVDGGDVHNMRMAPLGRLREPLEGMRRADVAIVTRADRVTDRLGVMESIHTHAGKQMPVLFARHAISRLTNMSDNERLETFVLEGRPVAMMTGIARPDRLEEDLTRLGLNIVYRRDFRDHHRYDKNDINAVIKAARNAGAIAVIITEKDAANFPDDVEIPHDLPVFSTVLEFRFEDPKALKQIVGC